MSIYNTKPAIIAIGDTNNGKSSTINTILSSLLNIDIEFYTSNKINASKTITIFNFINEQFYKIVHDDIEIKFNSLKELIDRYNNVIANLSEYNTKPVYIFINCNEEYNFVLIDIIGKTISNTTIYNAQLDWINKNYLNNIKLYITKEINIDICNNPYVLITHVDKINYNSDETIREIHYLIKDRLLNNTIKFISNKDPNIKKHNINDVEIDVLNKFNSKNFIINLLSKINFIDVINIDNFLEHMLNITWTNTNDILCEVNKFNNKLLLNLIIDEIKDLESTDIIQEKISLFNNAINEMNIMYDCFNRHKTGVKAINYLKMKTIEIFGNEYKDYKYDEVIDAYQKDIEKKYKNIIRKSFRCFSLCNENSKRYKK